MPRGNETHAKPSDVHVHCTFSLRCSAYISNCNFRLRHMVCKACVIAVYMIGWTAVCTYSMHMYLRLGAGD